MTYDAQLHDTAVLPCRAVGKPQPRVTWKKRSVHQLNSHCPAQPSRAELLRLIAVYILHPPSFANEVVVVSSSQTNTVLCTAADVSIINK